MKVWVSEKPFDRLLELAKAGNCSPSDVVERLIMSAPAPEPTQGSQPGQTQLLGESSDKEEKSPPSKYGYPRFGAADAGDDIKET